MLKIRRPVRNMSYRTIRIPQKQFDQLDEIRRKKCPELPMYALLGQVVKYALKDGYEIEEFDF